MCHHFSNCCHFVAQFSLCNSSKLKLPLALTFTTPYAQCLKSNGTNIITQWQNKLQGQDDRSGSFNFEDMHKGCLKDQPQSIPTTCRQWGTNYGNLKSNSHEDFGKIYALSIGNGDNGILNLNTTKLAKNKP